ncbi:MAG: glucosaminidase domain-containing protein [Pseudomonadota bacterium]|nr:glucosaminidase domain-containing protein [Pseudomonadota bacterium]|tara:strand:- start:1143 stop:2651 length:1509 start_codon:yes stop_codon:yes gene_type:complete
MKKKLSYRDKLLELAYIYNVKEIQDYTNRRKDLTIGQIELILKKNKIIIPKDFKSNFFKDNFTKPFSKLRNNIADYKEEKIKDKNRFFRKVDNYKHDTSRKVNRGINSLWRMSGNIGVNFLNVLPKLGTAVATFFGNLFTDVFNSIYNQQIDNKSAKNVILGFFVVVGVTTLVIGGINTYKNFDLIKSKIEIKKPETIIKKDTKKTETQPKQLTKKPEVKPKKEIKKPELKVKEKNVTEVILPDLNLKTETVIQLFKDVDYDLRKVRNEKLVKPIYFTQFPRDLDNLRSVQLKKETFIKIVLPLIVAENEKILDDRKKLKILSEKKFTSDIEKQWLRQKLLEYKVKKGDLDQLMLRMDMIPVSIALAQAAKESGWGTSRFALEGNAIFGQWTWDGQGIAPLKRDDNKKHKILKFPILRASVKAYKNNLNTHKSYSKFREKRKSLRNKKKNITGLDLTDTLKNYAQTGSEYTKILNQIITQNRLSDFEPVKLVNSVKQVELNS